MIKYPNETAVSCTAGNLKNSFSVFKADYIGSLYTAAFQAVPHAFCVVLLLYPENIADHPPCYYHRECRDIQPGGSWHDFRFSRPDIRYRDIDCQIYDICGFKREKIILTQPLTEPESCKCMNRSCVSAAGTVQTCHKMENTRDPNASCKIQYRISAEYRQHDRIYDNKFFYSFIHSFRCTRKGCPSGQPQACQRSSCFDRHLCFMHYTIPQHKVPEVCRQRSFISLYSNKN